MIIYIFFHCLFQIIGGAVLHDGSIAEMKTGEGKTLVSTLAAYLNALTGEGVHGMSFYISPLKIAPVETTWHIMFFCLFFF